MSDTTPDEPPAESLDMLLERLRRAADDLEAKREAVGPALELRDELIVQCREIGRLTYSQLAKAARCSEGTVHAVLASH